MLSVACIPVILIVMIARGFFGPRYTNDHDVTFAFIGDSVFPSIGNFTGFDMWYSDLMLESRRDGFRFSLPPYCIHELLGSI